VEAVNAELDCFVVSLLAKTEKRNVIASVSAAIQKVIN
jgi:hypothetical protein